MGNKGELLLSQYTGSKSLSFLCALLSLSIDQVNFIACQIVALFLSFALKKWVKDPIHRLKYCLISGVTICYFCFGVQILHVISSAGISYFVIRRNRSSYMPWLVFSLSMGYLSWLHLRRQFYDLANGYSLDITGPLMVLTQKVTSLAFAIGDGQAHGKSEQKGAITELQKRHAISGPPGFLEFWSFIFQFQSMLAGPLVFFGDFRDFIYSDESPSSVGVVLRKLSLSIFFAILYIKVAPEYDIDLLRDPEFLRSAPLWYKIIYITIATTLERTKYYHAWILSDAVCCASGLGYNKANKSWDLVMNVDAIRFEFGLNLKESLDEWNKGTMKWLRYTVYERLDPNIRTVMTYGASAMWHGFYPGYYITFLSGALFTSAARIVRKTVRPFFLDNPLAKKIYDFITWLTTRLIVSYVSFTFVLLDFVPSVIVYMRLYFFFHIAAIGAMVVLPKVSRRAAKMHNGFLQAKKNDETVINRKSRKIDEHSYTDLGRISEHLRQITKSDTKSVPFETALNWSSAKMKTG